VASVIPELSLVAMGDVVRGWGVWCLGVGPAVAIAGEVGCFELEGLDILGWECLMGRLVLNES